MTQEKAAISTLILSFTFMVICASTRLIPEQRSAPNVTPATIPKRDVALKRSGITRRIEGLRQELNAFSPSQLRSTKESEKLGKIVMNNSFWRLHPIGGVAEYVYNSRGNIDHTQIYDLKTLIELDGQLKKVPATFVGEKLGDYIARILNQMSTTENLSSMIRLIDAFENITPKNWLAVDRLRASKLEPQIGYFGKDLLRKPNFRYVEVARRYVNQLDQKSVLVFDKNSIKWMAHLHQKRTHKNSLVQSIALLLLEEANASKKPIYTGHAPKVLSVHQSKLPQ